MPTLLLHGIESAYIYRSLPVTRLGANTEPANAGDGSVYRRLHRLSLTDLLAFLSNASRAVL